LNNNDQDIELIKQTNTLNNNNQTAKKIIENQEFNLLQLMDKSFQQNSKSQDDTTTPNRSSETSETIHITTSVSLNVNDFIFVVFTKELFHFIESSQLSRCNECY
jgi:hypothetical protein